MGSIAILAALSAGLLGLALVGHGAVGRLAFPLIAACAGLSGLTTVWAPTVRAGCLAVPSITASVLPAALAVVVVTYVAHGAEDARRAVYAWVATQLAFLVCVETFDALASSHPLLGPELPGLEPDNLVALRPVVARGPHRALRFAATASFVCDGFAVGLVFQGVSRLKVPLPLAAVLALVAAALVDSVTFPLFLHRRVDLAGVWISGHFLSQGMVALVLGPIITLYLRRVVHPGVVRRLQNTPVASMVLPPSPATPSLGADGPAMVISNRDGAVHGITEAALDFLSLRPEEAPTTVKEVGLEPGSLPRAQGAFEPVHVRARLGTRPVLVGSAGAVLGHEHYTAIVFEPGSAPPSPAVDPVLESLALAGRTAASLAHDLANLVQAMTFLTQLPADEAQPELFKDTAHRMLALAERMKDLGRPPRGRAEPTPLRPLLDRVLAPYRRSLPGGATLVVGPVPEDSIVLADGIDLDRALVNLLLNASNATPTGSRVHVDVASEAEHVVLTVRDEGAGIEDVEAILRPYRSTRAGGTGLGLTTVIASIQRMGGEVVLESQPGAGTRVMLRLRRAP